MAQPKGRVPIRMGTAWQQTWQTDSDVLLRRAVIQNISQLLQKRLEAANPEWLQHKLPNFVKVLEERLYGTAATKEEYADQQTLESRLLAVARHIVTRYRSVPQHGSQAMSSSLGNVNSLPGSTETVDSSMFPTLESIFPDLRL